MGGLKLKQKREWAQGRAPYAADPDRSRGRLYAEGPSKTRNDFQRDRDRIIHCPSFRRLKDKTQVFVYDEGDHFRTRLTHTIEVSQIARSIARSLALDEDLAEALALAHDLGHPPFGHAGERALDACMQPFGGFDHNAQSLRVVTSLEKCYAKYDGLNLCWETLEGLVKHNGPLIDRNGKPLTRYADGLPHAIKAYSEKNDLQLWSYASAEAQAAAIADDIAYDAHDVDDGLRAGLFKPEDLMEVELGRVIVGEVDKLYPQLEPARRRHEITRRFITRLIEDVIAHSETQLSQLNGKGEGADIIRLAPYTVVSFSKNMVAQELELKKFLRKSMYEHTRVRGVMNRAEDVLRKLFDAYFKDLSKMPADWSHGLAGADEARIARRICDFIAGMTDRFALQEANRLFNAAPELR